MPTPEQLENGARGIAYRAWQLARCTELNDASCKEKAPEPWIRDAVKNAIIESALVNARALACFLGGGQRDVNWQMYVSKWDDKVKKIVKPVVTAVSQHLAHASTGAEAGELHPGAWPIPELAIALVGGLARFVKALDLHSKTYDPSWFAPSPVERYDALVALDLLSRPTPESKNPKVGELTKALQEHLRDLD